MATTQQAHPQTAAQTQHQAVSDQQQVDLKKLLEDAVRHTAHNQILETDTPAVQEYKMHRAKAKLFADSGMFTPPREGKGDPIAAAFTKIELGKSMGFTEAQSMMGISVVGNRPCIESQLRITRMRELGYSWETEWFYDKSGLNTTGVRLWLEKDGKPVVKPVRDELTGQPKRDAKGQVVVYQVSEKFTLIDAARIQLWEWQDGKKVLVPLINRETYKNFPRNMCFARCSTNLQRFHVPEALNGVNIPSREEVHDLTAQDMEEVGQQLVGATHAEGSAESAREILVQKIQEAEIADARTQEEGVTDKSSEASGNTREDGIYSRVKESLQQPDVVAALAEESIDAAKLSVALDSKSNGAPNLFTDPGDARPPARKGRKGWD